MTSLRNHEGYLMIDNRHTEGVSDAVMVANDLPLGAGRGLFESATYTCSHCNRIVVLEPKRTRERGFCRKCNQRICDPCNALKSQNFECKTMAEIIDETLALADRQTETAPSLLLGT